jgi:IS5 family transposase
MGAKCAIEKREHQKASVRGKVEHPFRVIKRQFCLMRMHFRGLAKNSALVITLFALSNLWMARERMQAMAGDVRPQLANMTGKAA